MDSFIIGCSEFGIDLVQSNVQIAKDHFSVEIYADQNIFDALSAEENSEWSWALYPPQIYLHEIPCNFKNNKDIIIEFNEKDIEQYEMALYFMEHNEFHKIRIEIKNSNIFISGLVSLFGKSLTFNVSYKV